MTRPSSPLFLLLLWLCAAAAARAGMPVQVTVEPLAFLLERIGGDEVEVQVLVPAGRSPEGYDPSPKEMARLANSCLWFRVRLPVEQALLERVTAVNPALQVVDLLEGLPLRPLPDAAGHPHPGEQWDPHVWTDPVLMKRLAARVRDVLGGRDPSAREVYARNYQDLARELDGLDRWIRQQLAPYRDRAFMSFHPAWGYYAAAYDLRQLVIEQQGKSPSPRHLVELAELARGEGVAGIVVQPQHPQGPARALARSLGLRVVVLDPLARDYLDNMRRVTRALVELFRSGAR
ncbi:MAG: ABC transporter substrate-binding protein [Gammaproteobacteria bacterium]|nr:MAG: ABC transporter substrate-binding protein [Gammaproteobacteria bacterium]